MGRLTAELVLNSLAFVNCLQEVELDLRGKQIAEIEALGATEDQYQVIDLSENEIGKVENFPLLPRLTTVLLNANKVTKIVPGLGGSLPNLTTLSLINNRIHSLSDLAPVCEFQGLHSLTLNGNPVQKVAHYRAFLVAKLPHLRSLDFTKVKRQERLAAEKLFAGENGQKLLSELAAQTAPLAGEKVDSSAMQIDEPSHKLSADQRNKIISAIKSAGTMDEVTRLEEALRTGKVPKDLLI